MRQTVLNDEQTLHDYIAHVRIFDKCFMGASNGANKKDVTFAKNQRGFLKKSIKYLRTPADKPRVNFTKISLIALMWRTRFSPGSLTSILYSLGGTERLSVSQEVLQKWPVNKSAS